MDPTPVPAPPHPPSSWVGLLGYGLVQIPVALHRGAAPVAVPLREVHRADAGRVRRRRFCEACGRNVEEWELARGLEHHGHRVVLTAADLEALPLPSQRLLDIAGVIPAQELDPLAHAGVSYYIAPRPGSAAAKPYTLLRDVLAERHDVGIVRVTIGTREHAGAVRSAGELLVLDLLHWPDEIRPAPARRPPPTAPHTRERQLMTRLMHAMSRPLTDVLANQHDTYRHALQQLAAAKASDSPLPPPPDAPQGAVGVASLVDALNASLARTQQDH